MALPSAATDRVMTVSALIELEVVVEGKAAATITLDPSPPSVSLAGVRVKVTTESSSTTARFVPVTVWEPAVPDTAMVSSSSATVSFIRAKPDKDVAAEETVLAGICTVIAVPGAV